MNKKNRLVLVSVIGLAFLMSFSVVAAYATSGTSNIIIHYPKGTICGDAQAGSWSPSQFVGHSNFQGFNSIFTVNKLKLIGGQFGSVSSSGGSLVVLNHAGVLVFYATYSGMSGHYNIVGTSMHLTGFKAHQVNVYINNIHSKPDSRVHVGTFTVPNIPALNRVLPCTTSDTLVSFTT